MTLAPNTPLGPYVVVAPLGAGGMGEVYRARDTRLDRDVAIKVLPERLANDADALARFEREGKAVAALSHPNILAIHDIGHERGISFVVTELLEGETLRERVRRSPIPWRKAIEIGIEIAEGLSAANAKGIIHRDLKPENLFITTAGHTKILDFGLARVLPGAAVPAELQANTPTMTLDTRPGTVLGTVNYMSPEQISGRMTDARTDIFSFGCVLYEMISGRRAFGGESVAEITTAILRDEPPALSDSGKVVPVELDRVIARCHEKKPEQRIQSARDLSFALRDLLSDSRLSKPAVAHAGRRTRNMLGIQLAVGVVVVAALLLTLNVGGWRERLFSRPPVGAISALAVLPLENVSRDPEQEYFVDGMTEALISDLAKIGGLKVISRTSVMRYKATTKSLPEIARELNVDAVVEGSVLRVGERVRITAQLIHAATDKHLWAESYDREMRDVLRLHSELAKTIAQQIKVTLTPQEQARLAAARSVNPAAHEAYLKGLYHWNKFTEPGWYKAIGFFREALDADPTYAAAYAGLAQAYAALGIFYLSPEEAYPKGKNAALKAVALDDSLAQAHTELAAILLFYERDWTTVDRELQRALDLDPNGSIAYDVQALYLAAMGRLDEAVAAAKRAQSLDPLSALLTRNVGWAYFNARDFEQTIVYCRKTLDIDPNFDWAHALKGWALIQLGRSDQVVREYANITNLNERNPEMLSPIISAYAAFGRKADAERLLDELLQGSKRRYVDPAVIALSYLGLGDHDRAFQWLETAVQQRSAWWLAYLNVSPVFDSLRSDSRFADLVRRVGLPPLPVLLGSAPPASPVGKGDPPQSPLDKGGGSGKIMLAVLPFENLSRDPEQDYFSDGLTEEMIAQLSRLNPKKLGVIARTSAMHYKNAAKTIDAIGRELGVAYIVEGSVRRAGERVRITAQLVQVNDQTHLWAENYERDLKDIFALQSDVAARVAGSLTVELLPGAVSTSAQARTINPAAHEAYLKGRFHWNKRTPDGLKKAVEYFDQAVSLAPEWPLAYVGLADAYLITPFWAPVQPSEAIPKAKAAAVKALEIDQSLGEAHVSLAYIATIYDWNLPTAEREFQRALELSPNYATAHHWYSQYLLHMGRHNEAIGEIIKAQELDPLSLIIGSIAGMVHYVAGDLERAETQLRKTLEFGPDFALAHEHLANTLLLQGKLAEAIAEAREAVRVSNNDSRFVADLGYVCAKAGQPEVARKILDGLLARSTEEYVASTHFALVHAGLDERDRMFDWLERAYQERDVLLSRRLVDPLLAPMRADPRFADLLRRVGLPAMK